MVLVDPETRVMIGLPAHTEVMDEVKVEVLRRVGKKVVEFQGE